MPTSRPFLGFMVLTLSGCCGMIRGNTQTIPITVSPGDATVTVTPDKPNRGATVALGVMILERKGTYVAHVTKDGYQQTDVLITSRGCPAPC